MKPHIIKENSWHHRLATTYGFSSKWDVQYGMDICTYIQSMVVGMLAVCFIVLVGSMFSVLMIVAPLTWVASWVLVGYSELDDILKTGFLLDAVAIILLSLASTIHDDKVFGKFRQYSNKPKTPPGFLKLAYRKFKDKTCFMVSTRE